MARVLIVEDQERVAKALALLLELAEIPSVIARSPAAALACLEAGGIGLVLQDMNFTPGATGGAEGIALFREIRRRAPDLPVVLMTAWAHLETAVELVREGAVDYVEKPWDDTRLTATVRRHLARGGARSEPSPVAAAGATGSAAVAIDRCGMVVASAAMRELTAIAARVAAADVPVLLTGESGTGKEKLAELIHANSPRRRRPLVKVDVGALPDPLLEAELFGAEAGAYTGATRRRIGRFEAADGGTILLDEIGNLSASGQAKLLRVLQTGEIARLGSSQSITVDVRVVAATNVDLARAIAEGTFREDLYYRLAVIELEVPPLSRRREEVLPLAEHFLARAERPEGGAVRFDEASRRSLVAHPWPGNVRELANRVRRAALLARGDLVTPADLGLDTAGAPAAATVAASPEAAAPPADDATERRRLEALLVEHGGVVSRLAAELGLSRQALYRRMERLGIVLERRPRS
ncbi:MAG: sigma-54-dependent Fis family transcriptional regulator [Acidobacteriota bacterium]